MLTMKRAVGQIVFAPYSQMMWPGRIVRNHIICEIKLYKIKNNILVPLKSLETFNQQTAKKYSQLYNHKPLTTAIKMAQRYNRPTSSSNIIQNQEIIKMDTAQLPKEEDMENYTDQQNTPIKKQEEDGSRKLQVQNTNKVTSPDFLYKCDELFLVQKIRAKEKVQFIIYHPELKKNQKITYHPKFLFIALLQYLLKDVYETLEFRQKIKIQKRILRMMDLNILQVDDFVNSDILTLVSAYIKANLSSKIENKFVANLEKYQITIQQMIDNYLEDYSKFVVIRESIESLIIDLFGKDI